MSEDFDPYHRWLGIAPEHRPPDHYQLLGIPRFESDADVIASAADRQMAHVRSYQSGRHSATTQRLLNELATARVCLLSPDQKAVYDERLRKVAGAQAPKPSSVPTSTPAPAAGPTAPADPHPPLVVPAPSAIRITASTPRKPKAVRRPLPIVWLGVGAGLLLGVLAIVLSVLVFAPRTGLVTLELDDATRAAATIEIGGRQRDVPADGPVAFKLPPGEHELVVSRPAHSTFRRTLQVVTGRNPPVAVQLKPRARMTIELTGRRPNDLQLTIDGLPYELPASRTLVVPCEPGEHVVKATSGRGGFEKKFAVLTDQNYRVAVSILADSRLAGRWQGEIEIDQQAVARKLDQNSSNPLVRAFFQQMLRSLEDGSLSVDMRPDGAYDIRLQLGPLSNQSAGRWSVTEERGSRVTVEFVPNQGATDYRQFLFIDADTFTTDLPQDLAGLGVFRCRRKP